MNRFWISDSAAPNRRRRRLRLETLELRRVLASFAVTTPLDVVDGGDSVVSLREAIVLANSASGVDQITFDSAVFDQPSTIELSLGSLLLTEGVEIQGLGQDLITIDAQGNSRIFNINLVGLNRSVSISGLTMTGGMTTGLNQTGGAIQQSGAGDLTLDQVTITNSGTQGNQSGGGAISSTGTLIISDSILSGNSTIGDDAGGGAIVGGGLITISGSQLIGNFTTGTRSRGGAIESAANLSINDSLIQANSTEGDESDGGAIHGGTLIHIESTQLIGNQTSGNDANGGAIGVDFAVIVFGGGFTIVNSDIHDNATLGANSLGGAIYADFADGTISQSSLTQNRTEGDASHGGGVLVSRTELTIEQSTLSGNQATGALSVGGGVGLILGSLDVDGVTVTDNEASINGGGIEFDSDLNDSNLKITNSIVAGNRLTDALTGAGVDFRYDETLSVLEVRSSLIGTNSGTPLIEAQTADADGNLIGGTTAGSEIDPGLSALAVAGSTRIHALLETSPAINAGDSTLSPGTVFDQRGSSFDRVVGSNVDMGAFEIQTAPVEINWNDPTSIFVGTALDGAQLNASSLVPGTFVYAPASGTVLPLGDNQTLTAVFTPDDLTMHEETTVTVLIDVVNREDLGDAPESYGVLRADDGPRHRESTLLLGQTLDVEVEGQPSVAADSDGSDDGVVFATSLITASTPTTASVVVTSSGTGKLDAWIDFNGNGVFDPATEHLGNGNSIDIVAGLNVIPFTIPADSVAGATFARFRLSSAGNLLPTGEATDGEVEDYAVNLVSGSLPESVDVFVTGSQITLMRDDTELVVFRRSVEVFRAPSSSVGAMTITGDEFSNVLTIDQTGGDAIPTGGLIFEGGDRVNTFRWIGAAGDLDLTSGGNLTLRHVDAIELTDGNAQSVLIDSASARQADPDGGGIIITGGANDHLQFADGSFWRMDTPDVVFGTVFSLVNLNDTFVQIDFGSGWQNLASPSDVNNSGAVTANDALIIINELGRHSYSNPSGGGLVDPADVDPWPGFYYDQNGDGLVTALDALRVINELARLNGSGGELVSGDGELIHSFDVDRKDHEFSDFDDAFADDAFIGTLF